jgi:hypothetical protein
MEKDHPVTQSELHAALADVKKELRSDIEASKDELKEFMRQIETNMLTAFHGYAKGAAGPDA